MLADRVRMGAGAGVTPAEVSQTDSGTSTSSSTSYTYASRSLGAADDTRLIAVVVHRFSSGAGGEVTALTVAGVSAVRVGVTSLSLSDGIEIWVAPVPTGTTGDVVVTLSISSSRHAIGVFRLIGADPDAYDVVYGTGANPATADIDIPDGGVVIAGATHTEGGGSFTWSGLTERYDVTAGVTSRNGSGASDAFAGGEVGRTVTATPVSGATNPTLIVAAWPPRPTSGRLRGPLITGGTNIGNMTVGAGLAGCFDGGTYNGGGYTSTNPAYVGKTISKRIYKAVWWGTVAHDTIQDANPSATITLYGKTGSAPGSATDGTALGSTTYTDSTLHTAHEIESSDKETVWDHIWCTLTAVGGAERRCTELQLYEAN